MNKIFKIMVLFVILIPNLYGQHGWIIRDSGTTEDLVDVYFINESTGWVVGGTREAPLIGVILHTTDGGQNWSMQQIISNTNLDALCFINENTGWAVGFGGVVVKTVNGGNSWFKQNSGVTDQLFDVFFVDANKGWAVGTHATIIRTTDGGTTWESLDNPLTGSRKKFRSVHFVDEYEGWVVDHDRIILKTTNGGSDWFYQFSIDINEDLRYVQFLDENLGWCIGEKGVILKTTNSGENWTHQNSYTNKDLWGGCFINSSTGWAVGQDGTILRTDNGGAYWLKQHSGVFKLLNGVYFVDQNHGCAVGEGGTIITTTTGGYGSNSAPQFISDSSAVAHEESFFSYTARAIDPDGDMVQYTFLQYPEWLTPDDSTISGTPPIGAQDTSFTVTASDGSLTSEMRVSIDVIEKNDPPEIVSPEFVNAEETKVFEYTARAADPEGDPVSYIFQNLPYWLSAADSVVTGITPSGADDTTFTLIATDGLLSDTLIVKISIIEYNEPPRIVSPDSVTGYEGSIMKYTARVVDPDDTTITYLFYDYPEWLTPLDSTISGMVPEAATDTSFYVMAFDGRATDTLRVKVHIIAVDNPPYFVSSQTVTSYEGSFFKYTARAIDPEDSTVTYVFSDYPAWMTPADSTISGTTPTGGSSTEHFTVVASDGNLSDTLTVTVNIVHQNSPPVIINIHDFTFSNNESYTIDLDTCVTDSDDQPESMVWQIIPENQHLNVNISTSRIAQFTVNNWYGTTDVKFIVSDPDDSSDSLVVKATVTSASLSDDDISPLPDHFILKQNYPNPFNSETTIFFYLPRRSHILVYIVNVSGKIIEKLFDGEKEPGNHKIKWNGSECPAGIYLIKVSGPGFKKSRKCILLK